jgi:hypothetical protein
VVGAKSGAVLSLNCPHARSQPALVDTAQFARCVHEATDAPSYLSIARMPAPSRHSSTLLSLLAANTKMRVVFKTLKFVDKLRVRAPEQAGAGTMRTPPAAVEAEGSRRRPPWQ